VMGFEEALATAVQISLEPGLVVRTASLPALALLKVFAWDDRGAQNPKDAVNLVTLLRNYHEAGNLERLYGEASAILEAAAYDVELASAWLLGADVQKIARPTTVLRLRQLLQDARRAERLVTDMVRGLRGTSDPIATAQHLLDQFVAGLTVG
jgi:predicted nucleotidyltransferase